MRCILLCCFWDSAAPAPVKPAEPKKAITLTFSGSKPRPKLFVGAAFFSTGKKPSFMKRKRKSTPRSSGQKPAPPAKSKAATVAPLKAGAKRPQQGAVAPGPTPSTKSPQRTVAEAVRAG